MRDAVQATMKLFQSILTDFINIVFQRLNIKKTMAKARFFSLPVPANPILSLVRAKQKYSSRRTQRCVQPGQSDFEPG